MHAAGRGRRMRAARARRALWHPRALRRRAQAGRLPALPVRAGQHAVRRARHDRAPLPVPHARRAPAARRPRRRISLRDQRGRLEVDEDAPRRVALRVDQRVSFERYAEIEADMQARLLRGERAERVLDAKPLPQLHERSWPLFAAELLDLDDGSRGGVAMAWFGDALLACSSGHNLQARPRPWHEAFERGAKRAKRPESREQVFNDWLGDELWMMRWLPWGCSFDVARAELATRLLAARTMAKRIERLGVREDQAAAEAVMAAELCRLLRARGATRSTPSPTTRAQLRSLVAAGRTRGFAGDTRNVANGSVPPALARGVPTDPSAACRFAKPRVRPAASSVWSCTRQDQLD